MQVEHHDLHHEFPEFADAIHALKTQHNHFARLFDEYHHVTKEVESIEEDGFLWSIAYALEDGASYEHVEFDADGARLLATAQAARGPARSWPS